MANLLNIIISVILPPLGVAFRFGLSSAFWINLILTILGYVPGLIHAIYLIGRDEGQVGAVG